MSHCTVGWLVPDILGQEGGFIIRSPQISLDSRLRTVDCWRWDHQDIPTRQSSVQATRFPGRTETWTHHTAPLQILRKFYVGLTVHHDVMCIITNSMHCLFLVYGIKIPLHVSGINSPTSGGKVCVCGKWYFCDDCHFTSCWCLKHVEVS
jgi:hypothetical protein